MSDGYFQFNHNFKYIVKLMREGFMNNSLVFSGLSLRTNIGYFYHPGQEEPVSYIYALHGPLHSNSFS